MFIITKRNNYWRKIMLTLNSVDELISYIGKETGKAGVPVNTAYPKIYPYDNR